jgi:D-methionine transport system substrate-binding protein
LNKFKLAIAALLVLLTTACSHEEKPRDPNVLRVGTIAGPETQLVEVARDVAYDKYGLQVEIIEFEDYVLPNTALNDGVIDVNVFQHLPYLEAYKKQRAHPLVVVGQTFVYPVGLYSKKHTSLEALPMKAKIAIPNDASNEARALILLQAAGLITLKESSDFQLTPKDIVENPRSFQFVALDAAQLPRILTDVDAAVINTNYGLAAGLIPNRDALYVENADSPYANLIVVREDHQDDQNIQLFIHAMQSKAVLKKAEELFQGTALPAWKRKS